MKRVVLTYGLWLHIDGWECGVTGASQRKYCVSYKWRAIALCRHLAPWQ